MIAEISVLSERLESQSRLLETQQTQQQELLTTVRKLQSVSPPVLVGNGTGMQEIQVQMLQMMEDLSKEVQALNRIIRLIGWEHNRRSKPIYT